MRDWKWIDVRLYRCITCTIFHLSNLLKSLKGGDDNADSKTCPIQQYLLLPFKYSARETHYRPSHAPQLIQARCAPKLYFRPNSLIHPCSNIPILQIHPLVQIQPLLRTTLAATLPHQAPHIP
jgi:hypothetical protein